MIHPLPPLPRKQYYPPLEETPEGMRYLTLAEARALECNGCGDCCSSLQHPDPNVWSFGAIPEGQHSDLNGGRPLIIPLTLKTHEPRPWRKKDAAEEMLGPFDCDALLPANTQGQRFCRLWSPEDPDTRPAPCDDFPLGGPLLTEKLGKGHLALIPAIYQRRCTWTDSILVPEDWALMPWRRKDRTLRPLPEEMAVLVNRAYELLIQESLYATEPKRGEWKRLTRKLDRLAAEHAPRLARKRR